MRYFTTPIFYPNDKPHIGHAYTIVITDILYRLGKQLGEDVWSTTGLDEHGQKVAKAALKSELDPQAHVDKMALLFQNLVDKLNANPNVFVRTTSDIHKTTALDIWQKLQNAGVLYEDKYAGWYSPSDEAFYLEADKPADAVWLEEPCMFFALSKMQDKLLTLYETHPDLIFPDAARNEIINWIKGGLRDLCITRKGTWGINIPNTDYTMYVWIDALTNYITAAPNSDPLYLHNAVHIMAKDILRFHGIYWPAILLAINYPIPKKIISHGWWIQGGKKMSKSIGNVVDPLEWISKFGADGLRYFFARVKKIENDSEINIEEIEKLYKIELLGGIGNLGQRLLSMIHKEGKLLESQIDLIPNLEQDVRDAYENYDPNEYANAIYNATSILNKYISDTEPWKSNNKQEILSITFNGWKKLVFWMAPLLPELCKAWTKQIDEIWDVKPTGIVKSIDISNTI